MKKSKAKPSQMKHEINEMKIMEKLEKADKKVIKSLKKGK